MIYSIKNSCLTVEVNNHGAELWSIRSADGHEYLWQGDAAFWTDRSPNLFPYIGRMINKQYVYKGATFPMQIHGLALYSDFDLEEHTDEKLVFVLKSSAESLKQYPWQFIFKVIYTLCKNQLNITFEITNCDATDMLYAVGGHPGFYIPAEDFDRYRLRFDSPCNPQRIIFTQDCFVENFTQPYPLANGTDIRLHHHLFDQDAIVLKNTAKAVTLEPICGGNRVTVSFPQMPYIGFWHFPDKECPYVCIEPWSSLPSAKGAQTTLEQQKDLLTLPAGKTDVNCWSIMIHNPDL